MGKDLGQTCNLVPNSRNCWYNNCSILTQETGNHFRKFVEMAKGRITLVCNRGYPLGSNR